MAEADFIIILEQVSAGVSMLVGVLWLFVLPAYAAFFLSDPAIPIGFRRNLRRRTLVVFSINLAMIVGTISLRYYGESKGGGLGLVDRLAEALPAAVGAFGICMHALVVWEREKLSRAQEQKGVSDVRALSESADSPLFADPDPDTSADGDRQEPSDRIGAGVVPACVAAIGLMLAVLLVLAANHSGPLSCPDLGAAWMLVWGYIASAVWLFRHGMDRDEDGERHHRAKRLCVTATTTLLVVWTLLFVEIPIC